MCEGGEDTAKKYVSERAAASLLRTCIAVSDWLRAGGVQANYDVTADGQNFIIPRQIAISEWPIVVIGWTDALRDRKSGANQK